MHLSICKGHIREPSDNSRGILREQIVSVNHEKTMNLREKTPIAVIFLRLHIAQAMDFSSANARVKLRANRF